MAEYYFSVPIDNDRLLCLAPLSDRRVSQSGQEIPDTSGYFLYETHRINEFSGINIIAQVMSEEAALKLREMLHMD